jgi:hypothetical protein
MQVVIACEMRAGRTMHERIGESWGLVRELTSGWTDRTGLTRLKCRGWTLKGWSLLFAVKMGLGFLSLTSGGTAKFRTA